MNTLLKFIMLAVLLFLAIIALAQKGTGNPDGISRQGLNPELMEFNGTIESIESGPCKYVTGKSQNGTHLLLQTEEKTLNIHLGPTAEINKRFSGEEGDKISLVAFSTDKLPEDHYIAKELMIEGETVVLRDENLKPVWAGKRAKRRKAIN